jgi:hypothetical protein
MHFSHRPFLRFATGMALLVCASTCMAALGGNETAVRQDEQPLGATFALSRTRLFSLYALTTPDGVHVRQYVSAPGQVFAVAWDGPTLPDLETLLGSYFPLYLQGQRQKSRGVRVHQSGVVIESGGMMRAFVGRAYLSDRLPANVTAQDIQ